MVTLGKHSKCNPIEMWDPIITIASFSIIGSPCTFMGAANHPSIEHREFVSSFPFANVPFGINNKVDYPKCDGEREIVIGNDVWAGWDCLFIAKVKIGDGAIIGARSVVVKDIPPYAIAAGNPCIVRKYRFSQEIIDKLLKIKWWNWDDETIIERINDFKDVNNFVKKYESNT